MPHSWPIGARLRFKLDAGLRPMFLHLRGTPAVVVGDPTWRLVSGEAEKSWRQLVVAFAHSVSKEGWARCEDLEPLPDDPDGTNPPLLTRLFADGFGEGMNSKLQHRKRRRPSK